MKKPVTDLTLDERIADALQRAMSAGAQNDLAAVQKAMEDHAALWAERQGLVPPQAQARPKREGPALSNEDAIARAIELGLETLSNKSSKIKTEIRKTQRSMKIEEDYHKSFPDDPSGHASNMAEMRDKLRLCEEHLEKIGEKRKRMEERPEEVFIPLGAVIVFRDVKADHDSTSIWTDQHLLYPRAGSVGVVTGQSLSQEFSIRVSMFEEWVDGHGNRYGAREDQPTTFFADVKQLEVIGFGLYPDGSECRDHFLRPTHLRDDGKTETIILSNGKYWRMHDFGEPMGIEALSFSEDMAELSWIVGTVEEFADRDMDGPS